MTLEELYNLVLIESGLFLLGVTGVELKDDNLDVLINHCLGIYSRSSPNVVRQQISVTDTYYTFVGTIPKSISEVIPLEAFGTSNSVISEIMNTGNHASEKQPFVWRYESPTLYLQYSGKFEVFYLMTHVINRESTPRITTITNEDTGFIKLLTGKYMQSIGRSRKAFIINDLPIQIDSSEMVSDGADMEKEAMEDIHDNAKFYLAWS